MYIFTREESFCGKNAAFTVDTNFSEVNVKNDFIAFGKAETIKNEFNII